METTPIRINACPRCQKKFGCRLGACWCTARWVPAAVLEAIKRDYTDCLCPECLAAIVAHSQNARVKIAPTGACSSSIEKQ